MDVNYKWEFDYSCMNEIKYVFLKFYIVGFVLGFRYRVMNNIKILFLLKIYFIGGLGNKYDE